MSKTDYIGFMAPVSGWDVLGNEGEGPTSQFTGLKRSTANFFVPDTTAHLQRSSGVHASRVRDVLASKTGPGRNVMSDRCLFSTHACAPVRL